MRDSRARGGSAMTGPGIALDFTACFGSLEATTWSVRDVGEKTRPDSRSCTIGAVERRHRRQNTRRFCASRVRGDASGEKALDTKCIARRRETAPFNELLSRMIFLA